MLLGRLVLHSSDVVSTVERKEVAFADFMSTETGLIVRYVRQALIRWGLIRSDSVRRGILSQKFRLRDTSTPEKL